MNRAYRAIAWGLVVLMGSGTVARAADELFPRPAELEPAVNFWTRVYTEVDTRSGFIHDSLRLDIVYQTVRFTEDMSTRERRRRVERATDLHRDILTKLGTGARQGLSADERRVLALFPEGTSNAEFRAAASRLRFQLGQSDRFRAGLIRSGTWKSYIHEVLDRAGLPRELAALPHVESSFDPTAYSKVGAAGLWQFTRSTGVRYMQIDHIVDERRDPFLATKAAARLLADNYSVVQTWPLALTAYNHGLAGMRRAVQQQQTSDIATIVAKYQSRSFGFASRNFYAAFLAALQIDEHPEQYFGEVKLASPATTDVIVVPAFVTADVLADALHVRASTLRELNPALMDTVWAGDKYVPQGFELRVPRDTAAVAEDLLAGIAPSERYAVQRPDREHRVRRGDTLSRIAAEYRVSLAALMRANGLSARDIIRVGQLIKLPVDAAGTPTPGPTPTATLARAESASAPTPAQPDNVPAEDVYVVRAGDSIERIASRLGVDQQSLLATNGIRGEDLIFPGQRLSVPGRATAAADTDTVEVDDSAPVVPVLAAANAVAPPTPNVFVGPLLDDSLDLGDIEASLAPALLANGEPSTVEEDDGLDQEQGDVNALASEQAVLAADPSDYSVTASNEITVQALETLGHYADWLGIPTQRLRDLNHLSFREAVAIGQTLTIDTSGVDANTFEQRRVAYHQQRQSDFFAAYQIVDIENHVIKPGESLWLLAERKYRVPLWLLRQYNPDLDLERLQPGIVVKFPRLKAVAPSVATSDSEVVAASGH